VIQPILLFSDGVILQSITRALTPFNYYTMRLTYCIWWKT